ncbi:MAG: S41 family peptidase [Defluviitaleaceae bacterium]|nr:S41 family peptidase [Defluviitaleaceae bacterium]MCL2274339.1 S41 family peptidase [Defluviitaleaceae bacterium]
MQKREFFTLAVLCVVVVGIVVANILVRQNNDIYPYNLDVFDTSAVLDAQLRSTEEDVNHDENATYNDDVYNYFLSDFEHLMTLLEENWPFFNIAYSARGVDMHELADNIRTLLNDPIEVIDCPIDFMYTLHEHLIIPTNGLAHLSMLRSYGWFFGWLNSAEQHVRYNENPLPMYQRLYQIVTRPETIEFYTRLWLEERGTETPVWFGIDAVMEFDILKPNKIAYMRISTMIDIWNDQYSEANPGMRHYEYLMYRFVQEIQGFEHLIIDLRGNTGGMTTHFDTLIMPQLLQEGIQFPGYVFFLDGMYVDVLKEVLYAPIWFLTHEEHVIHQTYYAWREAVFIQPLPYLDTTVPFAHAFHSSYRIQPGHFYYGIRPFGQSDAVFNGRVWVLVDERTGSAAEAATAILKYSGTATVVGTTTWGAMGAMTDGSVMSSSLPHTGILFRFEVGYVTDSYGRSIIRYGGIQPHYFNRPGMDALETVLAIINEQGEAP